MARRKEPLHIIVDTREQQPYTFEDFTGVIIESRKLGSGDYSVNGLTEMIAVERKSLEDFVKCVTHDRDRFFAQVAKLSDLAYSCIIIEGDIIDILTQSYGTGANPLAVLGSVVSLIVDFGVHVQLCGSRACSQAFLVSYLKHARDRMIQDLIEMSETEGDSKP